MKKLIKCLKSKAMLRIAMFATLFVLMDIFIEMNKKTEEQTTYSITLENLASAKPVLFRVFLANYIASLSNASEINSEALLVLVSISGK